MDINIIRHLISSINARGTCAIAPQAMDASDLMDACGVIDGTINEIPVTWGNQVLICYTSRTGEHRELFAGIDGGNGVTVCDSPGSRLK